MLFLPASSSDLLHGSGDLLDLSEHCSPKRGNASRSTGVLAPCVDLTGVWLLHVCASGACAGTAAAIFGVGFIGCILRLGSLGWDIGHYRVPLDRSGILSAGFRDHSGRRMWQWDRLRLYAERSCDSSFFFDSQSVRRWPRRAQCFGALCMILVSVSLRLNVDSGRGSCAEFLCT